VGDIHFEVFIRVCVPDVVFQYEGFPLDGERGGGYDINKGMAASRLVWWYRVSNDGGENCGVMMGRDMGGGKGSGRMDNCGLCWEGG